MERIMSEVANYFSDDPDVEVHLILLSNKKFFFKVSPIITIHKPRCNEESKLKLIYRIGVYLRKKLKEIEPHSVLSFGSMYNSFVLLSAIGLKINIYVSDRSNPYRNTKLTFRNDPINRHDGVLHFFLKKFLYPTAKGILVQTQEAKRIEYNFSNHSNIKLFPNPIRDIEKFPSESKEKWIINVGRFIKTKNQILLIRLFSEIKFGEWKLVFAGDGPGLNEAKKLVEKLHLQDEVFFLGNVSDVDRYLRKSEIFAFPSLSEGFPNALAEGMKASLACIAYDCVAGPSELIEDGDNGFLVPVGDSILFKNKLKILMTDRNLRNSYQKRAAYSVEKFDKSKILENLKIELLK